MSRFAKSVFDLNEKKRQLLEMMLREEGVEAAKAPKTGIPRRKRDESLPLSFAQQRLWLIDRMGQAGTSYNMPFAVRLQGALQTEALAQALQEITRRHESLRTTFQAVQGDAVQVIAPVQALSLPVVDMRALGAEERSREVQARMQAEASHVFSLAEGPLFRTSLLRVADEEHLLLLSMHHIVSDGWSMGVLFKELVALYESFSLGQPSPLPELPIQYADFALWQKERLQGEVLENQLLYWKQQLQGAAAVLELPTDRPHPPVQTYRGADTAFVLPKQLTEAVQALGQRGQATLFMMLMAAFAALLSRYCGQEDISLGTPIAGRTRTELEGMIGFFVNTLVMRTDLSGQPTFRELLGRVRQVALGAYGHQDVPFEKLVEALQPQRHLSHSPLFQVLFAVQEPYADLLAGGVKMSAVEVDNGTAKVDLTLVFEERAEGLRGVFTYNTDLFDEATIVRMGLHLQTLLESVVAHPDRPIVELPLLTTEERHRMLVEWNDTRAEYPRDATVHRLFEQQVARTPDAVAVVYGEESLSYAELNGRANRVARHLQALGVGDGTMVGLSVERSPELVVGMLGILKAGGVYVPLDPAYPQERLALMVADANVRVLVTQQHLRGGVLENVAHVVSLDADWDVIAKESDENLLDDLRRNRAMRSGDKETVPLAYVIYTSGSTGTPKGVCVPHRAVNRLVCNSNYVRLDASDRVAQVSNASFDAATFEIWGALLSGARLVGVTKDIALSPQTFAAELKQQGITAMFLTTSLFNQIAAAVPDAFSSLKHLLVGGEAVDLHWVREVRKHGAPARFLNVYGPTESTTFATYHLVEEVAEHVTNLPIGRPLANTEVYVLDPHLQPVPVGVPGELHIGGDGLAHGYLHRPELTAETFIPNPFVPGTRLYKTGDRVRYLADGNIEYLGRLDNQVKLRGFRIELGEIEYVLQKHPAVRESVVIMREDTPGDKRLTAYVVPQPGTTLSMHDLRAFVKGQLPAYMIPALFVELAALPLTPNGKVDRRLLPSPSGARPELEQAYVAPRNEIERAILAVWQEALQVEQVGIYDNFFDLGGHSLLVIKVHGKLQDVLQTNFSVINLFQYPTIDALTQFLHRERAERPTFQAAEERGRSRQEVVNRRKQMQTERGLQKR